MELFQILRSAVVIVISVLMFAANIAYIFYLNRDRNKWKHTANCYQMLNEKYKNHSENLIDTGFNNSVRYKVINIYKEQSAI